MEPVDPNPYAPPELQIEPIVVRKSNWRWALPISTTVYSLAYIVFTILLLTSNDIDQKAGKLFLLNIPILIGMIVCIAISKRLGAGLGMAFVCVQVAITVWLMWMVKSNWYWVAFLNFVIVAPIIVVTTIAWVSKPFPKREEIYR